MNCLIVNAYLDRRFCFPSCDFKNQYPDKTKRRDAEPHIVLLAQPYWSGLLINKVGISPVASESVWWDPLFLKMLLEQARFRPRRSGLNVNIAARNHPAGSIQQHQIVIDLKVVRLPPKSGVFPCLMATFFSFLITVGNFFPAFKQALWSKSVDHSFFGLLFPPANASINTS